MGQEKLIALLEEATRPNYALDCEIASAFGWTLQKMKGDAKPYWRKPGDTKYFERSSVPCFTSSIDAALTLVPEGSEWSASTLYGIARTEVGLNHDGGPFYGERKDGNVAIALCIAALKARRMG